MTKRDDNALFRYLSRSDLRAYLLCGVILSGLSFGVVASDNHSAVLRIGATIPPSPYQYPARCKMPPAQTITSVTVQNGVVRYVGSPPRVVRKGDLVTITF